MGEKKRKELFVQKKTDVNSRAQSICNETLPLVLNESVVCYNDHQRWADCVQSDWSTTVVAHDSSSPGHETTIIAFFFFATTVSHLMPLTFSGTPKILQIPGSQTLGYPPPPPKPRPLHVLHFLLCRMNAAEWMQREVTRSHHIRSIFRPHSPAPTAHYSYTDVRYFHKR